MEVSIRIARSRTSLLLHRAKTHRRGHHVPPPRLRQIVLKDRSNAIESAQSGTNRGKDCFHLAFRPQKGKNNISPGVMNSFFLTSKGNKNNLSKWRSMWTSWFPFGFSWKPDLENQPERGALKKGRGGHNPIQSKADCIGPYMNPWPVLNVWDPGVHTRGSYRGAYTFCLRLEASYRSGTWGYPA